VGLPAGKGVDPGGVTSRWDVCAGPAPSCNWGLGKPPLSSVAGNRGAAGTLRVHEPGSINRAVPRQPGERIRRILTGWLAVEFGAAVMAIAIVVALGPLVAVLLAGPRDPWLAMAAVLSVSVPVAVLLGSAALKLSWELLRQVRSG